MIPAGGCKGTTQRGQPCQAKDVYSNGYCKHHGGEGESLTERRQALGPTFEQKKARALHRIGYKMKKLGLR
jgi:hypothetical protein